MTEPTRSAPPARDPLDPAGYPWEPAAPPGVLVHGRFRPTPNIGDLLDELGAPPMDARHPVVAVGSNASPTVMHRKLTRASTSTVLPMTSARVRGIGVGHSAHVSIPGFIAAAPFRSDGADRSFVVTHLDHGQLAAVDATEPNYRRVRVGDVWFYASMWGVLAVGDEALTLRGQGDLHAALAEADLRFDDVAGGRPASAVASELAHDGTVNFWRCRWSEVGMAKPDGLG